MPNPGATLTAAITASGLSARRFAETVLGVDERTLRYWRAGKRTLPEPVRRLCLLLVAEPALAGTLTALAADP